MSASVRPFPRKLLVLVILLPAIPFLIAGSVFEAKLIALSEHWEQSPGLFRVFVVTALSLDIFLPVPSGPMTVYAGQTLGAIQGGIASWAGLTLGALFGYGLSRLTLFITPPISENDPLTIWFQRYGIWALIITRPLPLIAEACVLLAGVTAMPFTRFMLAIALSHSILSFGWAWLGAQSKASFSEVTVLIASVIIPLLFTFAFQWALTLRRGDQQYQPDEGDQHDDDKDHK